MAIDRAAVLRTAEKLLRSGKLEAAIAEYARAVDAQPSDWNTANTLGDLYLRVGQSDRALEQFVRIADSLSDQGFQSKAAALYKKILKVRPDDEHALLRAGELAAQQGVLIDARRYLGAVAGRRIARGDQPGVAEIHSRLFRACLAGGDLDGAREYVATAEERKALGLALAARGHIAAAAEFLPSGPESRPVLIEQARFVAAAAPPSSVDEPPGPATPDESAAAAPEAASIQPQSVLPASQTPVARPAASSTSTDGPEIDLSGALTDCLATTEVAPPAPTLDEVFARFRQSASGISSGSGIPSASVRDYEQGISLRESGRIEESIGAFEAASRDPLLRFHAARALAQAYRQRHDGPRAVEWLERAAQSPSPTAEEGHDLFYELASTLEWIGEHERALAVYLELQTEAGDYRDVPARIMRLTQVQARG